MKKLQVLCLLIIIVVLAIAYFFKLLPDFSPTPDPTDSVGTGPMLIQTILLVIGAFATAGLFIGFCQRKASKKTMPPFRDMV